MLPLCPYCPRSRPLPSLLMALGIALVGLGLVACDDGREEAAAWVARCARESRRAEGSAARGDHSAAETALRAIAEAAPPPSVAPRDGRVVRQEAYHRLALSRLARGRAEEARSAAEAGLALGDEGDLFTANLLDARGRAEEALGRDREAARDYHRAQQINERLLEALLEGAAGE